MTQIKNLLEHSLATVGIKCSHKQSIQIIEYLQLIVFWNKTHNLIGNIAMDELIDLHVSDSAVITKYVESPAILDIGSGSGFPGIILAILLPNCKITLLDAANKKIQFLKYTVFKLKLNNVQVVNCRIEDFTPEQKFNSIVARGISLKKYINYIQNNILHDKGSIYLMLGPLAKALDFIPQDKLLALPTAKSNITRYLGQIDSYV